MIEISYLIYAFRTVNVVDPLVLQVPDDLLATDLFFKIQARFNDRLKHTGMINKHNNVTSQEVKCGNISLKKCQPGWRPLVFGSLILSFNYFLITLN